MWCFASAKIKSGGQECPPHTVNVFLCWLYWFPPCRRKRDKDGAPAVLPLKKMLEVYADTELCGEGDSYRGAGTEEVA